MHSMTLRARLALPFSLIVLLAGCATMPGWIPTSGASRAQVIEEPASGRIEGIQLVDVDDALARRLAASRKHEQFARLFDGKADDRYLVRSGDVVDVTLWETPPAVLFGTVSADAHVSATTVQPVAFPSQMVSSDGTIGIPFAGRIVANDKTTDEIEREIVRRLNGKANRPQVMVRVGKNNSSNVTVVGEVSNSVLLPLTPRRERLLDALAASGGVKQPVNRMAIQLSRADLTASMPLDAIIRDPRQNIALQPGDVVTALFQSQSFSVLGATGKNEEIPFEAAGISLAQALARSGGLNDSRADARGVFIFRFEDPALVRSAQPLAVGVDGKVPVVYQVDLRDPASLFVTQNFPVQDHDVIYVANSPAAEFRKFLSLVVSVAAPSVTLNNVLKD
ncbi:polysaccharide export outer membrane protein [Herbaspirillum frisingense]|uniref:Polysaccharide export outer membrane protein n=2 Tax=Oxalobacteraceae TaxID=75682 RepID=A0ABU1PH12_9BURK|nr:MULTISPECIES: polysaccharide biosynthesis/export family protein [Herbaspirillum]MDR6585104.1 polysaccharide export outer membrane protein [Herbaspirillum frisingense]